LVEQPRALGQVQADDTRANIAIANFGNGAQVTSNVTVGGATLFLMVRRSPSI
jgi:hypothetical protein